MYRWRPLVVRCDSWAHRLVAPMPAGEAASVTVMRTHHGGGGGGGLEGRVLRRVIEQVSCLLRLPPARCQHVLKVGGKVGALGVGGGRGEGVERDAWRRGRLWEGVSEGVVRSQSPGPHRPRRRLRVRVLGRPRSRHPGGRGVGVHAQPRAGRARCPPV